MEISWSTIIGFIAGLLLFNSTGTTLLVGSMCLLFFQDQIRALFITPYIILPTSALGVIIILSVIPGALGGWRPIRNKRFLNMLSGIIVLAILFELVMGLYLWRQTVTPRKKFFSEWNDWPATVRSTIQTKVTIHISPSNPSRGIAVDTLILLIA
ncbi:hypothetical protein DSO57_1003877 [Entomophthora muscae]|uniref:Uncharacterized protein n=1 Tax=Entomophthora muscae TaxID=34485 RepID=A0ACC2RNA8_9FUNG|nr:hypothetical protein DSO57_1003877 [Entomophthora muscae]